MNKSYLVIYGNLLFAILVYFVLFQDLGFQPIMVWDESRNAVSALEMIWNHNFLIRHYEGQPDMWEVKPPLMVWLQAIFMKIAGYNEVAVRLPSVLSVLGIIVYLIYFFKKEFQKPLVGYFSGMVLLTSMGFMSFHIARYGDHDALLTFTLVLASFNYYLFLKHKNVKYLYYTVIALIVGAYTKSVVSLFVLPGLLVYTLVKKELLYVLRQKHFYLSIALFIGVVGAYYFLRELYNPGYLKAVWEMELFNRYTNESEMYQFSEESPLYYILGLFENRFNYWVYILMASPALFLFKKEKAWYFDVLLISFIITVSILLIISFGTVKEWYDAPIYPFMSIMVGITINWFWEPIKTGIQSKKAEIISLGLFFVLLFASPYEQSARNSYKPKPPYEEVTFGKLFRIIEEKHPEYNHFTIVHDTYNSHLEFYQLVFNRYKGYDIDRIKPVQGIAKGDTVMYGQWHIHDLINQNFEVEKIDAYENAVLAVLH